MQSFWRIVHPGPLLGPVSHAPVSLWALTEHVESSVSLYLTVDLGLGLGIPLVPLLASQYVSSERLRFVATGLPVRTVEERVLCGVYAVAAVKTIGVCRAVYTMKIVPAAPMPWERMGQVKREALGTSRHPSPKIRKDLSGPGGLVGAVPPCGPGCESDAPLNYSDLICWFGTVRIINIGADIFPLEGKEISWRSPGEEEEDGVGITSNLTQPTGLRSVCVSISILYKLNYPRS